MARPSRAGVAMRSTVGLVLAAFACGVVWLQTCAALPAHPAWLTGAAVCALVFAAVARERLRLPWLMSLAVAAALLAGFGYAAVRAQIRLAEELPRAWEDEDIEIVGVVDDLPSVSAQGTRFAFAVERVRTPRAVVPSRLSLAWFAPLRPAFADEDVPVVHAGERWVLTVRLKRPHGTVNPGGFDLEAWLLQQGLRATGYVHPEGLNARSSFFAGRPEDYVQRARERVRQRIVAALGQAPYAGVIVALAIGDQRAVPEPQWTVFNRTGVSHLVSISGLHVTVFAAFAGGLAYALARRSARLTARLPARKLAAVVGVVAAGSYVLLAGAEVPAVRTFAMLAIAACGLWWGRPGTAGVVWLWALAGVLLWDPWATLTPGFWLSFGAVGLLLYASAGRLRAATPAGLRARLRDAIRDGAHAQWVVTLGLAPLTLALFQQASLIAPVANAVAIPVVTLGVVPLALLGIVVPADLLFQAAHAVLAWLMRFLEAMASLPDATWQQHAPLPWTVAAGVAGALWLLAPRGLPGRAWGLLWLLPLFVVRPEPPPHGAFRLTVLDVGQGLSVVVETHHYTLVYDAGPRFSETADAGRPYRRAVSSRCRIAPRGRTRHQPPGPRSLRRDAIADAGHTRRLVRVVAAGRTSDRGPCAGAGAGKGGERGDGVPRGAALDVGRRAIHRAASDACGVRRSARQDQRPILRLAHRFRPRQRIADGRSRGEIGGEAVARQSRCAARRRVGRPAPRFADVVHTGVHPRRCAGNRRVRLRLPQSLWPPAAGHRRPLHGGVGANVAYRHRRRDHAGVCAGHAIAAGIGARPAAAVLDGRTGACDPGCRQRFRAIILARARGRLAHVAGAA